MYPENYGILNLDIPIQDRLLIALLFNLYRTHKLQRNAVLLIISPTMEECINHYNNILKLINQLTISDLECIKKFNNNEPLTVVLNYFKRQNIDYPALISLLQSRHQPKTMIPYQDYNQDWDKITILFADYKLIQQEYLYIDPIYDVFLSETLVERSKKIYEIILDYIDHKMIHNEVMNQVREKRIEHTNSLSNNYFMIHVNGDILH